MHRKLFWLTLICILALASVTIMAQEESELSETFELGGFSFQHPEDWDVLTNQEGFFVSNTNLLELDMSNGMPVGIVIVGIRLISFDDVGTLEDDATAAEILVAVGAPEADVEEIEREDRLYARVVLPNDELSNTAFITLMDEKLFSLILISSLPGESEPFEPLVLDILDTMKLEIEEGIAEESLERYTEIEQGISDEGFPQLGNPEAQVKIIELSSFGCPHCRTFHDEVFVELLERIEAGEVVFTYVPLFGIGSVPRSDRASLAAVCALEQGNFWPLHDALFAWQDYSLLAFLDARLAAGVDQLEIDREIWDECMVSSRALDQINSAMEYANGVENFQGTPMILINGTEVTASLDFINQAIDEILEAK